LIKKLEQFLSWNQLGFKDKIKWKVAMVIGISMKEEWKNNRKRGTWTREKEREMKKKKDIKNI